MPLDALSSTLYNKVNSRLCGIKPSDPTITVGIRYAMWEHAVMRQFNREVTAEFAPGPFPQPRCATPQCRPSRTRTLRMFALAMPVFVSLVLCSSSLSAGEDPCERTLGEVCLRPGAADLLKDVEGLYGKPVKMAETTRAAVGDSGVYSDGTPYIELNPVIYGRSDARREAVIVHELFHLKMKASGYPIVKFQREAVSPDDFQFLLETVRLVFDPIEHHLFASKIREMGLDPDAEVEDHFRAIEPRPEAVGFTNYYQRAMTVMRVLLECSAPTALRIQRCYQSNGWSSALDAGKQMAALATSREEYSPDDEVVIYMKCLRRLLENQADIRLLAWEDERHGQAVYRVAVLRVTHRA
jgi:hypothetical protein